MKQDGEVAEKDASLCGELAGQRGAVAGWVARGIATPLERWLDRLLDGDGVPRRLPVSAWAGLLAVLDQARRDRSEGWPDQLDARIEGLVQATFRFARAGGGAVFTPAGAEPAEGMAELLRGWAQHLAEPGLVTVLDWWFPRSVAAVRRAQVRAAPPLPAWSSARGPLAMLRANWSGQGDFLALDHRQPGTTALVELTGLGQVWLGPTWTVCPDRDRASPLAAAARPRPRVWVTSSSFDLAEWSFRLGGARVTRTALLLRGRRIALLADQVDGASAGAGWRVALPAGVEATPLAGGTGWGLAPRRGSPKARLVPLGLPCLPGTTERGTFTLEGRELRLSQPFAGRRCWLPLLVSWDPLRNRQEVRWRVLTVAEKSRICPPETAFAARVTWGRGETETLLIYRSLGPPALRSVLGHQTRARFLVGLFGRDGTVVPIVKVD